MTYSIKPLNWVLQPPTRDIQRELYAKFRGGYAIVREHSSACKWELWLGRYTNRCLWKSGYDADADCDDFILAKESCEAAYEEYVKGMLVTDQEEGTQ